MFRIAISGKGGVGKTTIIGILARLFGRDGKKVLAVDADPSPCLASILDIEKSKEIKPLTEMLDLIEERTGVRPGSSYGKMFILNPKVDDIAEKFGVNAKDNVTLLVLGTIKKGGGGCFCPESALLKSLIRHLVYEKEIILIIDMMAGLENFGRGTAEKMDVLIIVVEPGLRSIETASKIKILAKEIGVKKVVSILNKVRDKSEIEFVKLEMKKRKIPLVGAIPYHSSIREADMKGISPFDVKGGEKIIENVKKLKKSIEKIIESNC